MARSTRSPKLETRTARLKLEVRKKPYGTTIAPGVILLYRRNRGAGTWSVRLTDGKDRVIKLGLADDYDDADERDVLDYWQAQAAARIKSKEHEGTAEPIKVRKALDDYEADLKTRGADTGNVDRIRAHLTDAMLDRNVSSLAGGELKGWRDRLAKKMAAASVNRTTTCFKAALNLAADHDERIGRRPWQTGLSAIPDAERSRNVILSDARVRMLVEDACKPFPIEVTDAEQRAAAEALEEKRAEAFGLLVEVLAVTGARVSQAARLEPSDVQGDRADPRLMMPSSKKGKGTKKIDRRPVPVPAALALTLRSEAAKRPANSSLLVRADGEAWKKSDHYRRFTSVVERVRDREVKEASEADAAPEAIAKLGVEWEDVTIYALRHSSIVRQLLRGVPIRVVAVNHDTSVAMIEKNYSRFIADHSDALARQALIDLGRASDDNVADIGGRTAAE